MRLIPLVHLFAILCIAQIALGQTTQPATEPSTQPAQQKLPPGARKIVNLSYVKNGHAPFDFADQAGGRRAAHRFIFH